MSNKRLNGRDRLFIRKDGNGRAIAGTSRWLKRIPRGQGNWVEITECVINCCDSVPTGSFLVVQAASDLDGDTSITGISFPGYTWTGTIEAGDMLVVPLPYNFNETITFTALVETAGMDYTVSTIQGTGTIETDGSLSTDPEPQEFTVTVDAVPNSQYLIILSNS